MVAWHLWALLFTQRRVCKPHWHTHTRHKTTSMHKDAHTCTHTHAVTVTTGTHTLTRTHMNNEFRGHLQVLSQDVSRLHMYTMAVQTQTGLVDGCLHRKINEQPHFILRCQQPAFSCRTTLADSNMIYCPEQIVSTETSQRSEWVCLYKHLSPVIWNSASLFTNSKTWFEACSVNMQML